MISVSEAQNLPSCKKLPDGSGKLSGEIKGIVFRVKASDHRSALRENIFCVEFISAFCEFVYDRFRIINGEHESTCTAGVFQKIRIAERIPTKS